jgi:hypothetical protein
MMRQPAGSAIAGCFSAGLAANTESWRSRMQRTRRLSCRFLTVLAPVTVFASLVLAAPATNASASPTGAQSGEASIAQRSVVTPSAVRVYRVTKAGLLPGIHACRSLGRDRDDIVQAVYCADLYAAPVKGGVIVKAAVEVRCQAGVSSSFPRCRSAATVFTLNSVARGAVSATAASCGGSLHPCKFGGATLFLSNVAIRSGACGSTASQFWTRVSAGDTIHLPDGEVKRLTTALVSQHAIICT